MNPPDEVRVLHMIDAAEAATGFVRGRSRADLDDDRMVLFAVLRALEVLGEAASKVSEETRALTGPAEIAARPSWPPPGASATAKCGSCHQQIRTLGHGRSAADSAHEGRAHISAVPVNPQVPWAAMVAMRNRLIHGYFDVDPDIVWRTVDQELPPLLPALRALL